MKTLRSIIKQTGLSEEEFVELLQLSQSGRSPTSRASGSPAADRAHPPPGQRPPRLHRSAVPIAAGRLVLISLGQGRRARELVLLPTSDTNSAFQGGFMLTKVDLCDFFEINQGLYGELPASTRQVAMMRSLAEAFSLAPTDAARVSGGPVTRERPERR